jgi:single-stranded DNA-specific DHH superfamily exonuclease
VTPSPPPPAIRSGERILVHGDYDVDGMCCAALYTRVLRSSGATWSRSCRTA